MNKELLNPVEISAILTHNRNYMDNEYTDTTRRISLHQTLLRQKIPTVHSCLSNYSLPIYHLVSRIESNKYGYSKTVHR